MSEPGSTEWGDKRGGSWLSPLNKDGRLPADYISYYFPNYPIQAEVPLSRAIALFDTAAILAILLEERCSASLPPRDPAGSQIKQITNLLEVLVSGQGNEHKGNGRDWKEKNPNFPLPSNYPIKSAQKILGRNGTVDGLVIQLGQMSLYIDSSYRELVDIGRVQTKADFPQNIHGLPLSQVAVDLSYIHNPQKVSEIVDNLVDYCVVFPRLLVVCQGVRFDMCLARKKITAGFWKTEGKSLEPIARTQVDAARLPYPLHRKTKVNGMELRNIIGGLCTSLRVTLK